MGTCVGIDFGTCNIKVVYSKNNKLKELKLHTDMNIDGGDVPNVILYDKKKSDGGIQHIVGRNALKRRDFANTVQYVKKRLQQEDWKQPIANLGRAVGAKEAARDIFAVIKGSVDRLKAQDLEIAITVPVCYTALQKKRILGAAREAGLEANAVLSESFAAAFSQEELLVDGNVIFVFDLGGATLDISLVRINETDEGIEVEEISSCGMNYGGTDIDKAIYGYFAHKYQEEIEEIRQCDEHYEENLLQKISEMKEQLFSDDDEEVEDSYTAPNGEFYDFQLSQDEVQQILVQAGIKERIIAMLEDMFDQLDDVIKEDVTHVRLFGGSSSIPYFPKLLTEYFGADIFDWEDYDALADEAQDKPKLAVAAGAARYIAARDRQSIAVINRVPFHIGIRQGRYFKRILDRNRAWGDDKTGWITLDAVQLQQDGCTIPIYQSFANMPRQSLWEDLDKGDALVYIARLKLRQELYDFSRSVYLKLYIDAKGKVQVQLAQMEPGEEQAGLQVLETMTIE